VLKAQDRVFFMKKLNLLIEMGLDYSAGYSNLTLLLTRIINKRKQR